MYRDVQVPRVQDAYERPSAALILGSTEGAEKSETPVFVNTDARRLFAV